MAYKRSIDLGQGFDVNALWEQDRLARQQKKPKKGFWLDQLSTGGGIAGALGGAAAGAAAGSVVPILGTAAGGILGALLGGGFGSGAGEVGENAITGDNLMKNVGKEALIGGVTSLPISAGFKLARAGVKATTGIGKTGARELVEQAGRKVVPGAMGQTTVSTAANKAGKNLETLGNRMMSSQSQVTGAQARQMGIRPVETIGRVSKRTGLTNLDDMAEVSRGLTGNGQDSILDTLTRASVESTNGVDIGDLRAITQQLVDDGGSLLTDAQRKSLLRNVKNASTTMHGGSKGSLSTLANPSQALDQANAFRGTARELTNSFTATPEQKQLAKVYNKLAKHVEDRLYKSPGVNESIPMLTKAGADDLLFRAQDLRAAGNEAQATAYEKIAGEVRGVKDVQQLRKLKKDFVDLGKIDVATGQAQGARAFNSEDAISLMRKNPVTGTVGALMNVGLPKAAGHVSKAGRALQGVEKASARSGQALLPLAARQGAGRLLTADAPEQDAAAMQLDPSLMGQPEQDGMQAQEPSIGGVTKSMLEEAMMQAAYDGQTDALSQLKQMYDLLPEQAGLDLNASTAALAAKQDTAEQSLDGLLSTYDAAGGGQGVLGGNVANLMGSLKLNGAAGTYNDQLSGTARQFSRAMGEVGAGSNQDAESYAAMLPRLTDSPEIAARKIADLKRNLAAARQNTLKYGAGASNDQLQAY